MVAPKSPGVLEFASSCSLGLRELMEAGAPLEKMVGKGLAHPPVLSHCNQHETQVMLPFFSPRSGHPRGDDWHAVVV